MAGALLRSGGLKDFFALGAVGHPVYLSATQFRVAIKNQMGAEVADVFAIPQRNERGDTIDWYAPHAGPVVPWSSATPEEQAAAKALLQGIHEKIRAAAQRLEADSDSERQVFGRLLSHAMSFPDDAYVYIVNDKPVLTFWGFRRHDAPASSNALGLLPVAEPETPPLPVIEPAVAEAAVSGPPPKKRRIPWWLWLLLLLLLLLGLFLLRGCEDTVLPIEPRAVVGELEEEIPPPSAQDPEVLQETQRIIHDQSLEGSISGESVAGGETVLPEESRASEEALPADEEELIPPDVQQPPAGETAPESEPPPDEAGPEQEPPEPEQPPAQDQELPPEPQTPPPEPPPDQAEETPEEPPLPPEPPGQDQPPPPPLNIPQDALNQGKVDFLKGNWSSSTGLIDERGRPMQLQYQFDDKGEGTVSLKRSDGSVCRGKTRASGQQGRLVIQDQTDITCPDGQAYQASKVNCKVGERGAAECQGGYASGSSFPVDIRQSQ